MRLFANELEAVAVHSENPSDGVALSGQDSPADGSSAQVVSSPCSPYANPVGGARRGS